MTKEGLLAFFPKMTLKRYQKILQYFSSIDDFWDSSIEKMKQCWPEPVVNEFVIWKKDFREETVEEVLTKEKIECILFSDAHYPPLLRQIYDPPFALFVRGVIPQSILPTIAVVGTRKYTQYGKQITEELIPPLVQAGFTIVSGLALGIDAIAHRSTLESGGTTWAVLGGGVDKNTIHPSFHTQLAEKILECSGLLLSEYPPFTHPTNFTFPARNRIIAGLSLGTLVIEAGESSGSLITARSALDNNREVFAVPQNVTSALSIGTNTLLKQGAIVVTEPNDILQVFEKELIHATFPVHSFSPLEQSLLSLLSREPIHIDELIQKLHMESSELMSTLTLMEIKGMIKNVGTMMYIKK